MLTPIFANVCSRRITPLFGKDRGQITPSAARRIFLEHRGSMATFQHMLTVRKFFCEVPTCPRKIEASRLAPFVAPRARVTARLFQLVPDCSRGCTTLPHGAYQNIGGCGVP